MDGLSGHTRMLHICPLFAQERKNGNILTILDNFHAINNDDYFDLGVVENLHESINTKKNRSINKNIGNEMKAIKNATQHDTTSAMIFRFEFAHGDCIAYIGLGRLFIMRNNL